MRLGILTTSRVRRGRLTKLMPRMHRGIRMTITVLMWCSVIDKKLSNSLSSRFHLLSQNLLLLPILIHDLCIQLVRTNGVVTLEWWVIDNIVSIWCISWLVMCRCRMRHGGRQGKVKVRQKIHVEGPWWRIKMSRLGEAKSSCWGTTTVKGEWE